MIDYTRHTLDNGLRVLLHRDDTTPLATVNLLYCVGARDENPDRTGFAHLFEHLMFGGTRQYPDYDLVVDSLGGENNAFTNNDYTNYYLTVPAENLRQALLLEANRMRGDWNIQDGQWSVLDVQRRVVTEEYNQRYINQPYGDVWMLLRPLCYKRHPYRWCTIGADIRHVQEATLQDVKPFFDRFYRHPVHCRQHRHDRSPAPGGGSLRFHSGRMHTAADRCAPQGLPHRRTAARSTQISGGEACPQQCPVQGVGDVRPMGCRLLCL